MGEKLRIGNFGHFIFDLVYKNKYGSHKRGFDIEGAFIVDIDYHHIWIEVLDGAVYVPLKSNVKSYESMERPV